VVRIYIQKESFNVQPFNEPFAKHLILLFFIELIYSELMPPAVKRRFQPNLYEFQGQHISDNASTQYQYIGIVMTSAHNRRKKIAAKGRPDMRKPVSNHGHTDPGTAKEYPALTFFS
jgi:hypothetical protein